jgi:hypothetical protein
MVKILSVMKKYCIIAFIFLFSATLFAKAVITDWKAEPEQEKVVLTWKTSLEDGVQKFVIQRSSDGNHFTDIGEILSRGAGFEYRYEDDKLGLTNSIFYYRLRVVNNDNSFQYSEVLNVIPNISSISRSWGSIKALFR